jgi:signal transduction histidine kinase
VIHQVLELYAGKIQSKRLLVHTELETAAVIRAARGDLHQVLANLLSNAIDASPLEGAITIRIAKSSVDGTRVEIADEGPGISDEVARKLFEPFFTTKKDVGTGLGLWVSRRLVQQMGGELSYTTHAGGPIRGTTFRVRLHSVGAAAQVPASRS